VNVLVTGASGLIGSALVAELGTEGHSVSRLVRTASGPKAATTDVTWAPDRGQIDVAGLDYAYKVETANGDAHAARVNLASVAVAGARVNNVEAYVLDHGLPTSLLGMSYLGRLSAFEATPTSMILRP